MFQEREREKRGSEIKRMVPPVMLPKLDIEKLADSEEVLLQTFSIYNDFGARLSSLSYLNPLLKDILDLLPYFPFLL